MVHLDPRRAVVIGVGRHTARTHEGEPAPGPAQLIATALAAAVDDTGAPGVRAAIDSVRLVRSLSIRGLRNAPLHVARLAGVAPRETVVADGGGETPGAALARACADVTAGHAEVVAIVGGEAWFSRTRAEREGRTLDDEPEPPGVPEPLTHGSLIEFVHPAERALGIVRPIQEYPLFEQARRVALGRGLTEHRRALGDLGASFSAVAAANPYAWDRVAHTADEIATPSRTNRLVGFPYTKLMVSNEQVDAAAAMVVTTVGRARELGVPEERWVYPLAAASGEAPPISERAALGDSVLAREVGAAVRALGGRDLRDAAHVDLYSCFPSAVQIQAAELGIDDGRVLTATGGMRFCGGPWCAYALLGFAAVVERLRADPGSLGLVSANGGAITKLVVTLLSTEPTAAFAYRSAQGEIDAHPRRAVATGASSGTVESWTVMHGRGGVPTDAIVAVRTAAGERGWGLVRAEEELAALEAEDVAGRRVNVTADAVATID